MIDLRYLGITLIGVFLALAVGLMTGSALGSPDRRDQAYEALRAQMDLLRTDVQTVREENETSRRRLESREQFGREVLPLAVRNRLTGATVGIVVCGPLDERPFWGELETALQESGAQLGPIIRIPDQLRRVSALDAARLNGEPPGTAGDPLAPAAWAVHALARGDEERLSEIARLTGIEVPRRSSEMVRRLLVLTAIPDDERQVEFQARRTPEFRVLEAAQADGLRVVVAEPETTPHSTLGALASGEVPGVDNIDTVSGRIAAVLALAGADGRFGSKPGASRAIPPLELP
jgi:hypothetical protein